MVKSVQYGVRHNSARSVEAMPLALQRHGEIQGRIGQAGPQGMSVGGLDCNARATTAEFFEDAPRSRGDPVQKLSKGGGVESAELGELVRQVPSS